MLGRSYADHEESCLRGFSHSRLKTTKLANGRKSWLAEKLASIWRSKVAIRVHNSVRGSACGTGFCACCQMT